MAPRRPPADRKALIIDAAAQLFAERGYDAVGMDDIGEAVEVSGPSLYWHFPGKHALLAGVIEHALGRVADALADVAAADAVPTFEAVVRAEVDVALDIPAHMRCLLVERDRVPPDEGLPAGFDPGHNEAIARPALARLNPALDDTGIGVRLFAQLGGLSAVLRLDPPIARDRLAELVTTSIVAMAAAPPVAPAPTPPAPNWEPTRTRPEAIVHAARRLFLERGFAAVSMGEIARSAGISRPTVYHYFRSKSEILQEAWGREAMRFAVGACDALDDATSAEDALDRLARSYVGVVLRCLDLVHVLYRSPGERPAAATPPAHRRLLLDAWAGAVAELRPDLDEPEREVVVEMALGVAAWGVMAVGGDQAWRDDVSGLVAALVRG